MKEDNKNKINRRDFFKLAGAGTLASAAALYGCSGNKNNGQDDLSYQPQHGRPGFSAGIRMHAMAHPETRRWEWRRNRPGSRERPDRLCHCSRSELFRHLSRLCARSVGARHRHCLKTPSTGEILPCHKAVQLQSQHAQPRRVPCHVSPTCKWTTSTTSCCTASAWAAWKPSVPAIWTTACWTSC